MASMHDQRHQYRQTEPVLLDGPVDLVRPLPPEVIAAFTAINKRRQLLRSEVYRQHEQALMDLTYSLQHRPATRPPVATPRDFLRVVSWNIQRGSHLDKIMAYLDQHEALRHLDILLLNEVDIGMDRSGNRNVAADLADHLGFGYVYGNSYLCLGYGDARDGQRAGPDREALHGNAILSRFPFRRAENISVAITKDKFGSSEKRLGHKKALWAEVDTPLGCLALVAVHLDAYASAAQRGQQLRDVLQKVEQRGLGERVLLGGDLNANTYDAGSIGQLCLNVLRKLVRGGFPHAIHHYLHPYELYERPVFGLLQQQGFDYRSFNEMAVGTTRYEVGTFASESTVREQMPGFAVKILRRKLRPWNGVAQLKVDWFCGRGLQVLDGTGPTTQGEPASRPPTVVQRPTFDGTQLSDHDPILVDVAS